MGIRWCPMGPRWHKSQRRLKTKFLSPKKFWFSISISIFWQYWYWFWYCFWILKILILILILRMGKFWYWYWFWYWRIFLKNFDIDFDFENQISENIDIDIEQKFDIVPCLQVSITLCKDLGLWRWITDCCSPRLQCKSNKSSRHLLEKNSLLVIH